MTTHQVRSLLAAALLAVTAGTGVTACGEDTADIPVSSVRQSRDIQDPKPNEHQAYRELAESATRSTKLTEHQAHAQDSAVDDEVKPGEHLGRLGR